MLSALVLAGGCSRGPAPRRGPEAAPVVVDRATRRVVPVTLTAIGAVEPIRTVGVRSQVTGTLVKIHFQEGQEVQAGDLLFELDPRPFQNDLRSAEADLEKSRVQRENAERQVARYSELTAGAMISKDQLETLRDNARSLYAAVLASEAAVANAKLQLEYCSIRAPIAGRTGSLGAHEGDLVRASDSASALVIINQLSPIYVTFGVPQQNLAALNHYRAEGAITVQSTPPGAGQSPEVGELTFIDNAIDPTTGTLKIKATFANTDRRLWPGQFATVSVTLSSPEVTVVPAVAVQRSQTGAHVFVLNDQNIPELREVKIARTQGDWAVVEAGISPGETVITDGQLRVVPGQKVQIKPAADAAGSDVATTVSPAP